MDSVGLQSSSEDGEKGSKGNGILSTEAIGKLSGCWAFNSFTDTTGFLSGWLVELAAEQLLEND